MLTRRGFAGCAICAIAGFVATEVSAQGAPPAGTPGVTRKILAQMDGPVAGYVTILAEATFEAGVVIGRHTHPGIESSYVLEGSIELPIKGQDTKTYSAGETYQIAAETPHAGGKASDKRIKIASTYVVEKGKPLLSPAPA
jgi:quercetin dioxygenase-like cupin family protein